ncbi:hypothetical protein FGO68_gene14050 [Halteria grandinella]|uniref:Solute carrier family 35 member F6 n=1 Tax=Halteria grandinella TaxID=5974 RepID=A0A8J8T4B3_HALGN|nr:hypothetical protein FGO68_gene14050 [Halteria grandinella]
MVKLASSSKELHLYMIAFLLCVSSYTILTKFQDISQGKDGRLFIHPFWQTFVTAAGDSLALLIYFIVSRFEMRRRRVSSIHYRRLYQQSVVSRQTIAKDEEAKECKYIPVVPLLETPKQNGLIQSQSTFLSQQSSVTLRNPSLPAIPEEPVLPPIPSSPSKFNYLLLTIPAALSNAETVCKCVATVLLPASIVEMLSATNIIFSAILTVFYLKKKLYRHHYLAIFMIMCGVILVGLATLLMEEQDHQKHLQKSMEDIAYGIVLLQIGILCGTIGFIIEEKFMRNHKHLDPVSIVGAEGVSATCLWIFILPIFYYIPCQNASFCSNGHLEDTPGAWEDYAANPNLIYQSIAIFLIIPLSSICAVSTTKHGSTSQRITILLARNLVVWIFFTNVPYDTWLQLSGFIILTFGILLFNEIVILPWWGLNLHVQATAQKNRKGLRPRAKQVKEEPKKSYSMASLDEHQNYKVINATSRNQADSLTEPFTLSQQGSSLLNRNYERQQDQKACSQGKMEQGNNQQNKQCACNNLNQTQYDSTQAPTNMSFGTGSQLEER